MLALQVAGPGLISGILDGPLSIARSKKKGMARKEGRTKNQPKPFHKSLKSQGLRQRILSWDPLIPVSKSHLLLLCEKLGVKDLGWNQPTMKSGRKHRALPPLPLKIHRTCSPGHQETEDEALAYLYGSSLTHCRHCPASPGSFRAPTPSPRGQPKARWEEASKIHGGQITPRCDQSAA